MFCKCAFIFVNDRLNVALNYFGKKCIKVKKYKYIKLTKILADSEDTTIGTT